MMRRMLVQVLARRPASGLYGASFEPKDGTQLTLQESQWP